MQMSTIACICRICGLDQGYPAWGEDGETPTYNMCPCCGVEFGYEDAFLDTIRDYRQTWLANGGKWLMPQLRPEGWNLQEQLRQIPPAYR